MNTLTRTITLLLTNTYPGKGIVVYEKNPGISNEDLAIVEQQIFVCGDYWVQCSTDLSKEDILALVGDPENLAEKLQELALSQLSKQLTNKREELVLEVAIPGWEKAKITNQMIAEAETPEELELLTKTRQAYKKTRQFITALDTTLAKQHILIKNEIEDLVEWDDIDKTYTTLLSQIKELSSKDIPASLPYFEEEDT